MKSDDNCPINFWDLFGVKEPVTFAIFQSNGNCPVSIQQLDILVIELLITGAANLRTLAGILSTPVALETTN